MALVFDTSTSQSNADSASYTLSHTCSGNDRVLVVCIGIKFASGHDVTGVTYASSAMTLVNSQSVGAGGTARVYVLENPSSGANNIVVSTSGTSNSIGFGGISFAGANTGTPIEATNKDTGTSTFPSVAVTTVSDGAIVVDCGLIDAEGGTMTEGDDQTAHFAISRSDRAMGTFSSRESKPTAGSVTMDWTTGANDDWGTIAVVVAPAVVTTTSSSTSTSTSTSSSSTSSSTTTTFSSSSSTSTSTSSSTTSSSTSSSTTTTFSSSSTTSSSTSTTSSSTSTTSSSTTSSSTSSSSSSSSSTTTGFPFSFPELEIDVITPILEIKISR